MKCILLLTCSFVAITCFEMNAGDFESLNYKKTTKGAFPDIIPIRRAYSCPADINPPIKNNQSNDQHITMVNTIPASNGSEETTKPLDTK